MWSASDNVQSNGESIPVCSELLFHYRNIWMDGGQVQKTFVVLMSKTFGALVVMVGLRFKVFTSKTFGDLVVMVGCGNFQSCLNVRKGSFAGKVILILFLNGYKRVPHSGLKNSCPACITEVAQLACKKDFRCWK
jgi:hypothetical protein